MKEKSHPILKAKDLSIGYDAQNPILTDFSLEVYRDDIIGVIGSNGQGKTTLIKTLIGLHQPFQGTIEYYDEVGHARERLDVGYLPQHSALDRHFPISVFEVILSGLITARHSTPRKSQYPEVQRVMEELSITHLSRRSLGELSGGERQKVLLARAIISRPQLIVMDEPTTYIDERFTSDFFQLLPEINKYSAIVIVSHNLQQISNFATRLIQL